MRVLLCVEWLEDDKYQEMIRINNSITEILDTEVPEYLELTTLLETAARSTFQADSSNFVASLSRSLFSFPRVYILLFQKTTHS